MLCTSVVTTCYCVLYAHTPDTAAANMRMVCRVARIDKVIATHMRVSWYGRQNGRCTLTRYGSGPDEGQVRSGDVNLMQRAPLAVFDRFTGNKEVPAAVYATAVAKLGMLHGTPHTDQENVVRC